MTNKEIIEEFNKVNDRITTMEENKIVDQDLYQYLRGYREGLRAALNNH